MDISVVTVTWNSEQFIAEQIVSVQAACASLVFEHIIVDNNSSDQTVQKIEQAGELVRLVRNTENKGFAAANNAGTVLTHGEFVLFLNPDMRLEPGSLKKMIEFAKEHPRAGVIGCRLTDLSGQMCDDHRPRRFPTLATQVVILLKLHHLFPQLLRHYLYDDYNLERTAEVDSVRGSFMLVRREVIEKLGRPFDERYFIWYEDVDLCRSVVAAGFSVLYTPVITATDYVGQSFRQAPNLQKQRWFTKSMIAYVQKWDSWWQVLVLRALRPVALFLVCLSQFKS